MKCARCEPDYCACADFYGSRLSFWRGELEDKKMNNQDRYGDYRDRLPPSPSFPWPAMFSEPSPEERRREERAAQRRVVNFKRKGWLA